ncbi:hypothetical protein HHI36_007499 [Cryptolaemus montrouzieri]|uniref:Zinc finger CW-type PWWP domain protein 1 n=1 Tax=Cryptolaemus montrouzieri TaxID=559131 RepID=A0ABD2MPP0_9CUCU
MKQHMETKEEPLGHSSYSQTILKDPRQIYPKSPVYPEVFPRFASEPSESAFTEIKGNEAHDTFSKECIEKSERKSQLPNEISGSSGEAKRPNEVYENQVEIDMIEKGSKSNTFVNTQIKEESRNFRTSIKDDRKRSSTQKGSSSNRTANKKLSKEPFPKSQSACKKNKNEKKEKYLEKSNLSGKSKRNNISQTTLLKNDPELKKDFKKFSTKNKSVDDTGSLINYTQNSDISLNEPIIKEAFTEFMKKKKTFRRVDTPIGLTHLQKMEWLQQQRNVGVYVHCDRCDKIRFLQEIKDPTDLPDKWFCENNSDVSYNNCNIPQEKFSLEVQEDWIQNLYNAGSLVWAKVEGYPWWPGMIDDDPNTESYYWLDEYFDITPTYYHVTFFDAKEVTRAWLKPNALKPFLKEMDSIKSEIGNFNMFKRRIDFAVKQAKEASQLPLLQRLEKFSFIARYKKTINKPRDVSKKLKSVNSQQTEVEKLKKYKKPRRTNKKNKGQDASLKTKSCTNISVSLSFDDFVLPPSPVIENLSLEMFENI